MTYLPESEFNRIILTHSKNEWVDQVISLCKENGYKLVEIQFNKLCKLSSDPSWTAYLMVRDGHAESKWAMKFIENDKSGYPSGTAYLMVRDGHADSEWAKKVIENDKSGDPRAAAYLMVRDGHANKNWYEKITGKKF